MKNKHVHILNGDALKERFPKEIAGKLIVCRECLVDGNVKANSLEAFYEVRAKYLKETYGESEPNEYYKKAVSEIEKIRTLLDQSDVHLWFEDDLFCQVNFWFVCYLLQQNKNPISIYLVRPKKESPYSFGHMSPSELLEACQNKINITKTQLDDLSKLWLNYQKQDFLASLKIAEHYINEFPFLKPAIIADQERQPKGGKLGRPSQTIVNIINELKTQKFGPIFQEFCKREGIYGYGDLQVKRLFDELTQTH